MKKWLPILVCSLFVLNACGGSSSSDKLDDDNDTIVNSQDNCPAIANTDQLDSDGDGLGDVCDTATSKELALEKIKEFGKTDGVSAAPDIQDYLDAGVEGISEEDLAALNQKVSTLPEEDLDSLPEIQKIFDDLETATPETDSDEDGVKDSIDNCPQVSNADQKDTDEDGHGDACDETDDTPAKDTDEDGIADELDNCPLVSNADQKDTDEDGLGDACDTTDTTPPKDVDKDGIADDSDNCPLVSNADQKDTDEDGVGDVCDATDDRDNDGDSILNHLDNCPDVANTDQKDTDEDGHGDACDTTDNSDNDNDGILNDLDNCPDIANTDQIDTDEDESGDACDLDDDQDGLLDHMDNCILLSNPDQLDTDSDGIGDVCDPTPGTSEGNILKVGSTRDYLKPSDVLDDLEEGDIIEIDAGTYTDVFVMNKNNITIRGVGGMPKIQAPAHISNGKAIFVLDGDNIVLENLEISGAVVPDKNGAGIRFQSGTLTLRNCYFHHNENGILTGAANGNNMELLIEDSEFANNGHGDGYSHNMYVGHISKFTLRHSYSHSTNFGPDAGHLVKSRASINIIVDNRIMDEVNGRASRMIDLPNGGETTIDGNLIHQGANATNYNLVGYALEGASNSSQSLTIKNNVFVNERQGGSFIQIKPTTSLKLENNTFIGVGTIPEANNGDTGTTLDPDGDLSNAVIPAQAATAGLQ